MELGGYIAYTVGGYKCLPFGRDSGITDAIGASSSNFDMPQPIDLQPGRVGFRRTRLHSAHGAVFVYSAFVGVSETGANRPGSFLAVGLGFLGEIDCRASDIGAALRALLEELKGRVTQGNRFVAMPDASILQDFLSQNTSTLDGIRESVNLRSRPVVGKIYHILFPSFVKFCLLFQSFLFRIFFCPLFVIFALLLFFFLFTFLKTKRGCSSVQKSK